MSFEYYQRRRKQQRSIAVALPMLCIADLEFDPPRVTIESRPADFS
jgi:hypothetical protein